MQIGSHSYAAKRAGGTNDKQGGRPTVFDGRMSKCPTTSKAHRWSGLLATATSSKKNADSHGDHDNKKDTCIPGVTLLSSLLLEGRLESAIQCFAVTRRVTQPSPPAQLGNTPLGTKPPCSSLSLTREPPGFLLTGKGQTSNLSAVRRV